MTNPSSEPGTHRRIALFLDEHNRHVTVTDVIDRLTAGRGIVFLRPIGDTTHLSPTVLQRRFTAVAGFPISVEQHPTGRISGERGNPLMDAARVRAAMNEPPTWS